VEYWPTLNQAIVLTQIISMVIIITGLLLTNKKSMTFRFKKIFIPGSRIINATSILLLKHSLPSNTRRCGAVPFKTSFTIRAARNEILAVGYSYFYHFVKSVSGLLNGSDKNLFTISSNKVTEAQNTYQFVLRLWTCWEARSVRLQDLDFNRNDIKSPDF
jgi:hypothetical protein